MNDQTNFLSVTELAGDEVSQEQVDRICHRYIWASQYCKKKDVVEVACGTGQGLGILKKVSKSIEAGDISDEIIALANNNYGKRITVKKIDAQKLPFKNSTKDVVILFEAIYYLPNAEEFVKECKRVLRNDGLVLIATANKDLFDFNPSPHSYKYFGIVELDKLLSDNGFTAEFWGHLPVASLSIRQKVLRPIKKIATSLNLIPKTMGGKKLLKRLVFGEMVKMPSEVNESMIQYNPPQTLNKNHPDKLHKVIYCLAKKNPGKK